MINNRQNGRRRGRGGQPPRGGQPNNGSRVDNRARGNAAQLYEKYKSLARDAQMQGDRVNTEYYLQFSDHYFRVLSENRSRFDEQRRPREDNREEFGTEDEFEGQRGYLPQGADDGWDDGDDGRSDNAPEPQRQPPQRDAQPPRDHQHPQPPREGSRADRRAPYQGRGNGLSAQQNGTATAGNGAAYPASNGVAAPDHGAAETAPPRIEADRMPPPLTRDMPSVAPLPGVGDVPSSTVEQAAAAGDDTAPAPKRRRARKPRAEGTTGQAAETQA